MKHILQGESSQRGCIAGQMIEVMYALLKRDTEVLSKVPPSQQPPPPCCMIRLFIRSTGRYTIPYTRRHIPLLLTIFSPAIQQAGPDGEYEFVVGVRPLTSESIASDGHIWIPV